MISAVQNLKRSVVLAVGAMVITNSAALAQDSSTALNGLDPVTFQTSSSPKKGSDSRTATHSGVTYRFSSSSNQKAFERSPGKFAPVFGGHDPLSLANDNEAVLGDASVYSVVGGHLYLFRSKSTRDAFLRDFYDLTLKAKDAYESLTGESVSSTHQPALRRASSRYELDRGLAIDGYDPVSYFSEGGSKPKKGTSSRSYKFRGVTYRFSSDANLERFKSNPSRYEPAHGGWCSYAMSKGSFAKPDVKNFKIQNGQLLLFVPGGVFSTNTKTLWDREGPQKLHDQADRNWKSETREIARR